jgi:hypothetical protein
MTGHLVSADLYHFSQLLQASWKVHLNDILPPAKLYNYCDHSLCHASLNVRELAHFFYYCVLEIRKVFIIQQNSE